MIEQSQQAGAELSCVSSFALAGYSTIRAISTTSFVTAGGAAKTEPERNTVQLAGIAADLK